MRRLNGLLAICVLATLLAACGSTGTEKASSKEAASRESALEPVQLKQASERPELSRLIDIGIPVFTLSTQASKASNDDAVLSAWVGEDILDIERQYLPLILRNTLLQSNQWGSVRILPKADPSTELEIIGTVLESDGAKLVINIVARDSSGRQWLNKTYRARNTTEQKSFSGQAGIPFSIEQCQVSDSAIGPFGNLYRAVANDLLAIKQTLSDANLAAIRRVAEVRHAQDLAPQTYADLLDKSPEGRVQVKRLLARNDPMQIRVDNMRARHHLFIDAVDEHYLGLQQQMKPIYALWTRYSCERELEKQIRSIAGGAAVKKIRPGGFAALSNSYRRYNTNKIFEQEWSTLAKSFTVELSPLIVELNDKVYTLSGSVEQQYGQWRKLLREFYRLENQL